MTPSTELAGAARPHAKNNAAFVSLFCGIASLVPLVIVLTFFPAIIFGVIGLVKAQRLPDRTGRQAAYVGIFLALTGLAVQAAVAGLASIIGLFGDF